MVHVKNCPTGKRGKPSTEFFKDGKPQIYCTGWVDRQTDEPMRECTECPDYHIYAQSDLDALGRREEADDGK